MSTAKNRSEVAIVSPPEAPVTPPKIISNPFLVTMPDEYCLGGMGGFNVTVDTVGLAVNVKNVNFS